MDSMDSMADRLLEACRQSLTADELAVVRSQRGVLIEKQLVSPDMIRMLSVEQLVGFGLSAGGAVALKKAFPTGAGAAGAAGGGAAAAAGAGGAGTGLPRDMQDAIEEAVAAKFAATQQEHKPEAEAVAAAMAERVSKVLVDGQCVGTVVRITAAGLCVSATHVLVDQGKFLRQATAFGGEPLHLLGSSPWHDVVFVKGPPGSAFELLHTPLAVGLSLTLLAHPLAPQLDLSTADHPVTQPVLAQGHVVAVAPSGDLVAADYHGAMPSSSGGAVLWGNTHFAGLHLGTSYHLDTMHAHDQEEAAADPRHWDSNPADMWHGSSSHVSQGKRRAAGDPAVALADKQLQALVLHAANNIAHKDQLAVFVPASTIVRLAQHHKLLGLSEMEVVQQQHVARSLH